MKHVLELVTRQESPLSRTVFLQSSFGHVLHKAGQFLFNLDPTRARCVWSELGEPAFFGAASLSRRDVAAEDGPHLLRERAVQAATTTSQAGR